jgi:two-component system OmpR family response regulator
MAKRILVVEDDASLAELLRDNLVYEGFTVDCVSEGPKSLEVAAKTKPDLVLLDLMIPGLDGFEVCRGLSLAPERVPIIILTARTQPQDKIRGLELGADDYVTKPFMLAELLARVHAVLRRTSRPSETLTLGDVVVDLSGLRASRGGVDLPLNPREFALLHYLAEHAGKVVSREDLLRDVWRHHQAALTRSVDMFIARLRRKIEPDPQHPRFIRTVHGDGYCLILDG